jgi:hypothetical protein
MKQVIGILLILFAIWIGIDGVNKFDDSTADVKFLGIRIHTEDSNRKNTAVLELGLAVLVLGAGVWMINQKGSAIKV